MLKNRKFGSIMLMCFALSALGYGSDLEQLAGVWQNNCKVSGSTLNKISNTICEQDSVSMMLVIHQDHSVTGTVGGAELTDCYVKKNRGWLGKKLNMKTDFVIKGKLINRIVECDDKPVKEISAPFNLVNGQIKGSLFWMHKWKYPDPLIRVLLKRQNVNL